MGSSLNSGPFWGSCFIRVPFYAGDPKRDRDFENYPDMASTFFALWVPLGLWGSPVSGLQGLPSCT